MSRYLKVLTIILLFVSSITVAFAAELNLPKSNLVITYTYSDGTNAADTYEAELTFGEYFRVESPIIPNYTASRAIVTGTNLGEDIHVDIVYYPGITTSSGIVDITIPSEINLSIGGYNNNNTFSGETNLDIHNEGSPIILNNIEVTPLNWEIADNTGSLGLNKKSIGLTVELSGVSQRITNEHNIVEADIRVETGERLPLLFIYDYGTWTDSHESEEAFSIKVNYSLEQPIELEGTLQTGSVLNSAIRGYSGIKRVVFTDAVAPIGITTQDISVEKNGSIVYWVDNETFYVSNQKPGEKIKANVDMKYAFRFCSEITEIDLSNLDTTDTISMEEMFRGCTNLILLDLSSLDTHNVTSMNQMFEECTSIGYINISNFDTSNCRLMSAMFRDTGITEIDLSNFRTPNLEYMDGMFTNCKKLTKLELSSFDTSKVVNFQQLFHGCELLTTLDLSNFDTSSATTLYGMFYGCKRLSYLDLSNFDTSNVVQMPNMFAYCTSLREINLSSFDTSNVEACYNMFAYCEYLTNLDLSNLDTTAVTSYGNEFTRCDRLKQITFGDKTQNIQKSLPKPSSTYISGANGYWYNESTGKQYAPANIPNNTAATYTAIKPTKTINVFDTPKILFQDVDSNLIASYPIIDSNINQLYPDNLSNTGYWLEPKSEGDDIIIQWYEP